MRHSGKRVRATVIVRMGDGILLAGDSSGLVLLPGGGVDHGELLIVVTEAKLN